MSVGNGPLCPVDPAHGRLYSVDRGPKPWFCPHQTHGANGRYLTEAEAYGALELKESDVNTILETAVTNIISGKTDLETAVAVVSKKTKRSTSQVREQINEGLAAVAAKEAAAAAQPTPAERKAKAKADASAARAEAKATKAAKSTEPKVSKKGPHVEPAAFKAERDRLGMTNKEVSAALGLTGMGCTLSRVTELTHSKGSSQALFDAFVTALETWRTANPAA